MRPLSPIHVFLGFAVMIAGIAVVREKLGRAPAQAYPAPKVVLAKHGTVDPNQYGEYFDARTEPVSSDIRLKKSLLIGPLVRPEGVEILLLGPHRGIELGKGDFVLVIQHPDGKEVHPVQTQGVWHKDELAYDMAPAFGGLPRVQFQLYYVQDSEWGLGLKASADIPTEQMGGDWAMLNLSDTLLEGRTHTFCSRKILLYVVSFS